MRVRLLLTVVMVSAVASVGARRPTSLFDGYQARDFARFDADLTTTIDFEALVKDATAVSSSWPADVAAAYLLEVSAAAAHAELFPRLPEAHAGRDSYSGGLLHTNPRTDWGELFKLSQQCAQRNSPTSPVGRAWGRAALALLVGASEVSPQQSSSRTAALFEDFAKTMRGYADDEAVSMARGNMHEALVTTTLAYDLPAVTGDARSTDRAQDVAPNFPAVQGTLVRSLNEGMKAFLAGMSYPDTRAEAAVRLAGLAVKRDLPGDPAFALSHLELARTWNPDPDVLYASWVIEGQADRLRGDTAAATRAFTRAADLTSNGSAARLGLAVQGFLAGDAATADRLAQEILNLPAGADDPWILFQQGDYRHWGQRVDALRKALQ